MVCNFFNDNIGQYKDIRDMLPTIQTQLTTNLNQIKDDLKAQINELKSMSPIKPVHDFQFKDVIQEFTDRQKRKVNLKIGL